MRTLLRGRVGRHLPSLVILAVVASVAAADRHASAARAAQPADAPNGGARPASPAESRGFAVPPSPAPGGFVLDGGPVLSPAERASLDARIRAVQQTTGGDAAVAVLRDLGGAAPSDAGLAMYRAWKVGTVDRLGSPYRDLGALLLVVPKELAPNGRGECWITTGLGAEGTLTDARAGRICREAVIPHLRQRRHAAALRAGVDAIAEAFVEAAAVADSAQDADEPAGAAAAGETGDDTAAAQEAAAAAEDTAAGEGALDHPEEPADAPGFAEASDLPWVLWLAKRLALIAAAVAGAVALVRGVHRGWPRRCPAGHGPMARLDEVADDAALAPAQQSEERLASVDYDVWACSRCPERVVVGHRRWLSAHERCARCGARTLRRQVRPVRAATTARTGLEEHALHCLHCGHTATQQRTIPRRSSSGAGSGGGGRSSSSFGGSGRSSGGGGGSSY